MLLLFLALLTLLVLWRLGRLAFFVGLRAARTPQVVELGRWAWRHPIRALLSLRWPRLAAFLSARLALRHFENLPLTLLVIAAIYAAALFGGLIEELHDAAGLITFDAAIRDAFQPWRHGALLQFFLWLTHLGDTATLTAVALSATGLLWSQRTNPILLPLWVTIVGANTTTWISKFAIGRPRPEFITAATAVSSSFPSGHATGAMALYGFIAYIIARRHPTAEARFDIAYWTAALILLIGFSRIYLSVHYASDVVGGFLVGGFWLMAGITLAEWRRAHSKR